jgi:hypothetical protein
MNRSFAMGPLASEDSSLERQSSGGSPPAKRSSDCKVTSSCRKTALNRDRVSESLTASSGEWRLISGNSNLPLAEKVADNLGVKLTPIKCTRFNDGECNIQIIPSVRNLHVYVVQSTCPSRNGEMSINDHVMELFLLVRYRCVPPYAATQHGERLQTDLRVILSCHDKSVSNFCSLLSALSM